MVAEQCSILAQIPVHLSPFVVGSLPNVWLKRDSFEFEAIPVVG
jgi:hypothetical protein